MRLSRAFPAAALLAALAGCGDATSSALLNPLPQGRFDAVFRGGGLEGNTEGTAWISMTASRIGACS